MDDCGRFLDIARNAAAAALKVLDQSTSAERGKHFFDPSLPREMKARADMAAEGVLFDHLRSTGLPILSEESGWSDGAWEGGLRWIVDPLDGTVNFVRGLAPCAVSVALWRDDVPVFGVLAKFPGGSMAWGGAGLGAFVDGQPVRVAVSKPRSESVLCTGFPSRFDFNGPAAGEFWALASSFGKVRMFGSAALSLLHVARGAADAYLEKDIMLWDVAAGLALVAGAGGFFECAPGGSPHTCNVIATNGHA